MRLEYAIRIFVSTEKCDMPTLKEMRLNLGLTQTELAKQVGCNQTTINRVENFGTGRNATINMIHYVLTKLTEERRQNALSNTQQKKEGNKPCPTCSECSRKDAEISDLKRQINMLIETNAVLAAKPSSVARACGVGDQGKHREGRGA